MRLVDPRESFDGHVATPIRFLPPDGQSAWKPVQFWSDADWTHWLAQHDGWTPERIARYLERDRYDFGFGLTKQGELANADNAHDEGVTWLYKPTPQGVTLHASKVPNILWGGSAGGAKSTSARWELWRSAFNPTFTLRPDAPYRAIIVRRELEQLMRSHLDKFEQERVRICTALGDTNAIKVTTRPALVTVYPTGARIVAAHAHSLGDEEKYLSEDYDDAVFDEATRLHPQQIVGIAGRLRSDPKTGRHARMMLTTNPGGPSHDWCVSHFLSKHVDDDAMYDPADYEFIASRLSDNPFYQDATGAYTSYLKTLNRYKPARRKQLMDGDWNAVVGQFFEDYDAAESVRRVTLPERCKVEVWFRSGEGGKVPYACWVVCLPDGRLHVLAELLMPNQTIGSCAATVNELTREKILPAIRGRWSRAIGSADLFPTKTDVGEPPSETCRKAGLYLLKGDQQEVFGWQRLKHWFARHPIADTPWLTVDPDCAFLRRTLPTLVQDPDAPDLLDPSGDTQAAHALRIGVMARPSPSILNKPDVEKPKGAGEIHSLVQRELHPNVYRGGMVR